MNDSLSVLQQAALRALKTGGVEIRVRPGCDLLRWGRKVDPTPLHHVRAATIHSLKRRGLAERLSHTTRFQITTAGRQVLKDLDDVAVQTTRARALGRRDNGRRTIRTLDVNLYRVMGIGSCSAVLREAVAAAYDDVTGGRLAEVVQ